MDEIQSLKEATRDLLFPSERDHPFEVFCWESDSKALDAKDLLKLAGQPAGSPVETIDLNCLFENVTTEKDWFEEEEKRTAKRFRGLVQTLKHTLSDIKVFRVGKIQIDVYVAGRTQSGKWVGIKTKVIET
jgi:hypothetical protein